MTYQVLARKWRPQDFTAVVGQQPIVTALRNALTDGRIAQAYLFSGIRGVGKTSVARILAKALNCERGPAAEPCNDCVACQEITRGSDLDVIEVDAATYSKVEQVRELTESLKYGPARDRYKVVVVDEIHRLSRQAFDALLKIVEEPPPHLAFIFATTEIDAVPATILSRCQEFRFRRVPSPALAAYLGEIAAKEGIEVGDAALRMIARAGDGSVRDAVALLDQLATFGSGVIPDEDASRILGGVDHAIFRRLLESIVSGASGEVSAVVREIEEQGWDPRHVYTQFLGYCRDALHLALGVAEVDLPAEEAEVLKQVAIKAGYENLLRLLHQLLNSEGPVRHSETGTLALEIAWLRLAELPKLVAVEKILSAGGGLTGGASGDGGERKASGRSKGRATPAPSGARRETEAVADPERVPAPAPESLPGKDTPAPAPRPQPAPETTANHGTGTSGNGRSPHPEPDVDPEPAREPESAAFDREPPDEPPPHRESKPLQNTPSAPGPPPPTPSPAQDTADRISNFLERLSRLRQVLAAHLQEANRLTFEDGCLLIYAPPRDPWLNRERLEAEANRRALEGALEEVWGTGTSWRLLEERRVVLPETGDETRPGEDDELVNHPTVQTVLEIFGGKVESVVDEKLTGDGQR